MAVLKSSFFPFAGVLREQRKRKAEKRRDGSEKKKKKKKERKHDRSRQGKIEGRTNQPRKRPERVGTASLLVRR
jgi:hypothetical protein